MADNAGMAREILNIINTKRVPDGVAAGAAAVAQAYATLALAEATGALVEQQRIANLIAYSGAAGYLTEEQSTQIREGLGLSDD